MIIARRSFSRNQNYTRNTDKNTDGTDKKNKLPFPSIRRGTADKGDQAPAILYRSKIWPWLFFTTV
jgi:hypothetical protein